MIDLDMLKLQAVKTGLGIKYLSKEERISILLTQLNEIFPDDVVSKGGTAFNRGYNLGKKEANLTAKRNKNLEATLKAFIGYDKEWLMTDSQYKKLNKNDLIETIKEQRQLLKWLFDNLDENKKLELKAKIDDVIWNEEYTVVIEFLKEELNKGDLL